MKKLVNVFVIIVSVMLCIGFGKSAFAITNIMQKPTDWNYIEEVYDSDRVDWVDGKEHLWYKPGCSVNCNGEAANGKVKKCRFGDYCDALDSLPFHTGLDYQSPSGSADVRATAIGVVLVISRMGSGSDHGLGNTVILGHYCVNKNDCLPTGTVFTQYSHMKSIDDSLSVGMWVAQGRRLGEIGGSGSNDPHRWPDHLHFEVKRHPVLSETVSDEKCMTTALKWRLFSYPAVAYGYSPQSNPRDCGYFDPDDFIGKVAVKDLSTDTSLPASPTDGVNGEYGIQGFGYAYVDEAEQPIPETLPDFITVKTWLTTPWQTETYQYGKPETMQMHAQFENIGSGNCQNMSSSIEVHFYLSQGYKEDDHTQWKRVGTDLIQCSNLTSNVTHSEEEGIDLWIETPEAGIHNIVACIDHIYDDHNEGGAFPEEHESNNGSTEAVFEVTTDGQVVNKPNIDYMAHSFQFLQTPTYAGDPARFGGYIQNIGIHPSQVSIRSNYSVECPGTGRIQLTDDGTDVAELTPGTNNWEQTDSAVTLPNATGTCTAYLCADYQNAWTETNETNNCAAFSFTLYPRPKPILNIIKFQDEVGCCTTNLGSRIKPDVWIQNTGSAAPSGQVVTMYQISSPIATGGAWWTIGYGASQPSELPPGTTDEDYMDGGGWQIPVNNAWKNQWHTVRACVNRDGGSPTCSGNDSIATYTRFSKK